MKLKCPICKKDVVLGEPDFPFCSDRCRKVDLGNWSAGKYVISSPASPEINLEEPDEE
jgi:uncharacterized protein